MGPSVCESDLETQTSENIAPQRKNVKFNPFLKVILVPSRVEYKCAGLCPILWWTSSDFFSFQQSAHSEVRLLSAFENIGGKEARKKLYQPNSPNSELLENMSAPNDYFLSDEETDGSDSDNEEVLLRSPELVKRHDYEDTVSYPRIVIKTSFHKVSSLDCISASLRHSELAANELISPSCKSKDQDPDRLSFKEIDEQGDEAHLQLCVPLSKPNMLNTHCGKSHSRKPKKYSISSTIALWSTFLIAAFVLVDRYSSTIKS